MNKYRIKCIVCSKSINLLYFGEEHIENPESACWNGAGVHEFIPGYGSIYDLRRFIIGICDECITKKEKEGCIKQYAKRILS